MTNIKFIVKGFGKQAVYSSSYDNYKIEIRYFHTQKSWYWLIDNNWTSHCSDPDANPEYATPNEAIKDVVAYLIEIHKQHITYTDIIINDNSIIQCECGKEKHGFTKHSDWCPCK